MRYEANEDVLDSIEEGIQALEAKDLTEAKKSLDEGRELMLKQQKLVRIAGREELGVAQYISHHNFCNGTMEVKHRPIGIVLGWGTEKTFQLFRV